MKKVYASQDRLMVGYFKNLLENHGLSCFVKNEYLAGVAGEIPLNECWPEIWVSEDCQYKKAKEILKKAINCRPPGGPSWKCSDCGETHGSQFTECWNCGKSRPGMD